MFARMPAMPGCVGGWRARIIGITAMVILSLLAFAGCSGNTASQTLVVPRFPAAHSAPPLVVRYLGREFSPTLGPVRGDLLAMGRLESTGLALNDVVVEPGDNGNLVFAVPGVPLNEGFLVVYHGSDWPVYFPASAYPTCQLGTGAYVYTVVGASPPPPPLGPVTPSAAYPGGPTPTPVPTPSFRPLPADLTPEGLLNAGWPRVNLELLEPAYQGISYRFSGFGYIDERGSGASIPPGVLEELGVLSMTYRIDVHLPPPLGSLVIGDSVTDRVRVFRFKDRPGSEVIIVEQCPPDFQGDQYLFYKVREPK